MPHPPFHHIALIGIPGAGKSSTGRRLSKALNRPLVDIDSELERLSGKSIAEIFTSGGERSFRALEAQVSHYIASSHLASIIATGGGWAVNTEAVAHLRSICRIIYLRVSPGAALGRMGRSIERRPLLCGPDALNRLTELYEGRRRIYEELADVVLDTETLSQEQLVNTISRHVTHE